MRDTNVAQVSQGRLETTAPAVNRLLIAIMFELALIAGLLLGGI